MARAMWKRIVPVVMVLAASSYFVEASAAPSRSAAAQARGRSTPRQRALTRLHANRALRAGMSPISAGRSSLVGLKGASSISTAALTIDQANPITTAAVTTTTAAPTLQDVWEALAPTMRFASLLEPDPNTGLLPDSAFVADLQSRRAVNQARFDTYHPQIAQLMDWDSTIRNSGTPSNPRPAVNPPSTNPQVVIPEPSSILIALGLIGFVAWNRKKPQAMNS